MNARGALAQSIALTLGCLASYALVTHALAGVHSLSRADDLVGIAIGLTASWLRRAVDA